MNYLRKQTGKRKKENRTNKLIELDDYRPHKVSEVICIECGHRWIAVRPKGTLLKDMECHNPKCQYRGRVIETGEDNLN